MSASCSTGLSLNAGVYHFFLTYTMSCVSHGINCAIEVVSTSEPSGNRCWNPAVQYASGHIDFRRTHAAVSAPRACGLAAKASAHRKLFSIIPAGIPLQGIVNDTRRTPKVSLERLILLVDYIGAYQCLPNIYIFFNFF